MKEVIMSLTLIDMQARSLVELKNVRKST